MCSNSEVERPVKHAASCPRRHERSKLWELENAFHCSVLGTCLSMIEMRKVLRQLRYKNIHENSDYQTHAYVVSMASTPSPLAKRLHKLLDKKYQTDIARYKLAQSAQELALIWRSDFKNGNVTGSFWAIVTHPFLDESTAANVFGDVHMLSHISGASLRSDMRRLPDLERELTHVKQKSKYATESSQKEISALQSQIGDLRDIDIRYQKLRDEHDALLVNVSATKQQQLIKQLQTENAALDTKQRELNESLTLANSRVDQRNELLVEMRADAEKQSAELARCRHENHALNTELGFYASTEPAFGSARFKDVETNVDLNGRRVLYLGGKTSAIPHLKQFVERHNGELIHHDGGKEHGSDKLDSALNRADVVVCPVDCVSHEACIKAKRCCHKSNTVFLPIRKAGVTSFAQALQQFAGLTAKPDASGLRV